MNNLIDYSRLPDFIVDGGLIDTILTSFGLCSDVPVTDDYTFFYNLFVIGLVIVFVVFFCVVFFRCFASIFKSARV